MPSPVNQLSSPSPHGPQSPTPDPRPSAPGTSRRRFVAAMAGSAIALVGVATGLRAGPALANDAAVDGLVTDRGTGQPLGGAAVQPATTHGKTVSTDRVRTDGQGR